MRRKDLGSANRARYKSISKSEYIKKFCGGKYSEFIAKKLPREFRQDAYHDITVHFDDERELEIVDSFYIGD